MHLKVRLSKLNWLALLLTVFLLPFTGIAGFSFLGELQGDASAHIILLIGFPIFLYTIFYQKKVKLINNWIYLLFIFFLITTCITSVISINTFSHVFKGKSGYEKFILQYSLLLFFSIFVCHYFYYILSNYTLDSILLSLRKIIKLSYILVCIYAFFEVLHIYGIDTFTPLLKVVDQVIRSESEFNFLTHNRIRSVSPEPPFLTLFLVFAVPWLLSYFITHPQQKLGNWILLTSIILLVYFSGSRSGLVIITLELILFFALQIKQRISKQKLRYALYIGPLLLISFSIVLYHSKDEIINKLKSISVENKSDLQVSSISRWGTQDAALGIALDNPIVGVGFGQQGFYFPAYYSKWSYSNSYEIRDWASNKTATWPPGFSMFTRLAAETGFVNAIFFFAINILLLVKLIIKSKTPYSNSPSFKVLATICAVMMAGYILTFLQWDSFRLIGYWLLLSLSFVLFKYENKK
jgi:hypothetical protein